MDASGVRADVRAYNALMAAFAREPSWEKAWAVFAAMRRAGLQPSVVSYNTLLAACERCGGGRGCCERAARSTAVPLCRATRM